MGKNTDGCPLPVLTSDDLVSVTETYSALIDYYEHCVLSGRTDLIKVASVIYEMKMEYAICIVARPAMMPANHKEIAELEKNIK